MSLIPRNTFNNPTPFTPFSQDFWDQFFHPNFPFPPFPNLPSFPFSSPPHTSRTIPYSELSVETSGNIRTRLECKEIPEAHLIVAELTGIEKDEIQVTTDDGGFVTIAAIDGRFSWRLKLPEDAKVGLLSSSMENGVLTVVVPKFVMEIEWESQREGNGRGSNVRVVEITGSDE
ncbi:18.3 kDa class I heat shock protein-like [Amaranthus tricolor]|uniref:18.3 kDa class I heat shock protein-like n=1 Tax=Amaranthus tricolor TaxID=29722 RepID=UPI002584F100|nr:18.3 kDa class I heat shock protein-like [Amaranthus tricolor]